MGVRNLTRWQKASALIPMAVLLGAWAVALTDNGLATAANDSHSPGVPDVPATAFEQPATVPSGDSGGVQQRAGTTGTISTLSASGIPEAALAAYHRAETLLAKADPSCRLPWTLVAAIGRVESDHGRSNGNTVNDKGISSPGIYGIALTGTGGTVKVLDTDGGALDRDAVYDHAVGPMQFLPSIWDAIGVDADGDGVKNPQDINDAAAAAGVYLCAGSDDLSTRSGASAALLRYNHSSSYADLVLKISSAYAQGEFAQTPNGQGSSAMVTSKSPTQTLAPAGRDKAQKDQRKIAGSKSSSRGNGAAPGTPSGPSSTPPSAPANGGATSGGQGTGTRSGGTITGAAAGVLDNTPLGPVTKPVTGALTKLEAQLQCGLKYPFASTSKLEACVDQLTH